MMRVSIDRNPENRPATALVFDIRNSTKLYRKLSRRSQRIIIVDMMGGIHSEIMTYLYDHSGLDEDSFAFNDTGDGYLITFFDNTHSFSCILCACYIREFLKAHLSEYNHRLSLDNSNLTYSFGIGVHRSTVRLMAIRYETPNEDTIRKKIIIGNAANSAARVESVTKRHKKIDLLITGYAREEARKESGRPFKGLFNKDGPYLEKLGRRHNIGDGKSNGHTLYSVTDVFYQGYRRIASS